LFTGCSDDDTEEVSTFVGNFVISKATVSVPVNLSTTAGIPIPIPVGMDITGQIQAALLSSLQGCSADKSWIELRKDKTIYMSCESKSAFNAGTWEEISETELKLNMNSAAIPSSPSGSVLVVTGITKSAAGLKGTTSVPMPKDMFAAGLAAAGFTIANTPPVYTITFTLEFSKK